MVTCQAQTISPVGPVGAPRPWNQATVNTVAMDRSAIRWHVLDPLKRPLPAETQEENAGYCGLSNHVVSKRTLWPCKFS
jgi:hypothetical protein